MTTVNPYFTMGTRNEQYLIEDIIIESLRIYGMEMMYIPRTLVSKDDILGEDRLSKFLTSFPIEMYFENIDSFGGQGFMQQKFGLMIEQSATLVVARRRWEQFVGRYGVTTVPDRPNEGDLIYFPLTKGLFEIKFVQHQDPFYQLGKLYVYKLQVELFQYASENIRTGAREIDIFESLKSFSTDIETSPYGVVYEVQVTNQGYGYTTPPDVIFINSTGQDAAATAVLGTGPNSDKVVSIVVTNNGSNYTDVPLIQINGDGEGAQAIALVTINIDEVESYGDNNKFKQQGSDFIIDTNNVFGDIKF